MRSSKILPVLASFAVGSALTPAFAAEPPAAPVAETGWIATVKGNVQVGPAYPGADKLTVFGYPSLSFRRAGTPERFSAPDDGFSFSILDDSALRVGVVGRFQGGRYLQTDHRLFGLDKINWAVEPGVFVEYWPVSFLRARVELRHGINGHNGFVADLGLDYVRRLGAFTLSLGPRVALGDTEFTKTYFGVTPFEASLNGLVTPFNPTGGVTSVGATAGLTYDWSPRWSTTAFVTYKRLVGDAANSPIVKRLGSENQVTVGLTVSYSFNTGF
ncbi:MipA/OmpV family protein [Microvirga terricola]|uniref:MipA/OmpV family protein n=1 Tax=Microvirga terricola TaxID=2719797 RepID=A0ABX0V9G4_9HYPH|nr:MipA/OmpV family protein [Microvirga terricola]NIX75666.1 MipA/OmpV family protein [Microvirga terricola]